MGFNSAFVGLTGWQGEFQAVIYDELLAFDHSNIRTY